MTPSTNSPFTTGEANIPNGGSLPCHAGSQDPVQQGQIRPVGSSDSCLTEGGIGKVGYGINFNRVFFQYHPPRPLHEIDAELDGVEQRILELLREVTE